MLFYKRINGFLVFLKHTHQHILVICLIVAYKPHIDWGIFKNVKG